MEILTDILRYVVKLNFKLIIYCSIFYTYSIMHIKAVTRLFSFAVSFFKKKLRFLCCFKIMQQIKEVNSKIYIQKKFLHKKLLLFL